MSQQHVNVRPEEVEAGGEATTAKPSLRPIGLAYESDFIDATESTMRDLMKQDYEEHNIEYGGYLCNHMFHALVALWRLGAPAERLKSFYKFYSNGLQHSTASQNAINGENWRNYLGQKRYYRDYSEFFQSEITRFGSMKSVINEYLPQLVEGLTTAAFHPLIHLGLAIDSQSEQGVANALAYLCYSYLPLARMDYENEMPTTKLSIQELLDAARKDSSWSVLKTFRGFQQKYEYVSRSETLRHKLLTHACHLDCIVIESWPYTHESASHMVSKLMATLKKTVLFLHYQTGCKDFFLLHGVTSFFSLEFIVSMIEKDEHKAMITIFYFVGLIFAFLAEGAPMFDFEFEKLPGTAETDPKSWDELIPKIIDQDGEHLMKLCYACREWNKTDPHPIYFEMALHSWKYSTANKQKWVYHGVGW